MGTSIRWHLINARNSHSMEMMEFDFEMDLPTIRTETSETLESSPVLDRLKLKTSHKIFHTANQDMINLTILLSADMAIDLRLVLRLMNKMFLKTISRRHLIWFVLPQPTIPIMNYQTPDR